MIPFSCTLLLCSFVAAQATFHSTRHAGLPPIPVGTSFAVGDVDGDGDLDLVVGNDDLPNQLLQNDGRGRFADATAGRFVTPPGSNATQNLDLADIDGDGDLDILVANDDYLSNRVYRNDGTGVFTDVTATALPQNAWFTVDQVVGDFDGDGDVDWFTADDPDSHLYLNNGAGTFVDATASHLVGLPQHLGLWYNHGLAADFDRDGDLDLLVPEYLRPVILLNQGNAVFAPAPTALPLANYSWGLCHAADLDLDGDLDLLLDNTLAVLQNQGNGTFVNVTATAFPGPHTWTPAVFDVDLDGDIDVLTTTKLWQNDGAGHFTAQILAPSLPPFSMRDTAIADFDGDGDIDMPLRVNFLRQVDALGPPTIGQSYTVDVHVRPGPAPSVVVAFAALAGGITPAGAFGTLRLDQTRMATLAVQVVTTGPLALTWALPNAAAFVGTELHYQALVIDPLTGAHLTNAIRELVQ